MQLRLALLFAFLGCVTGSAHAQTWGDLNVRFVFAGKVPKPINPMDESLVVNVKNGGLANIAVYLMPADGETVTVHPDYAKTANDEVHVDHKNRRFDPHIVIMRTTQTLVIGNPSPIGLNAKCDLFANTPFNELIQPRGSIKKTFPLPEKQMSQLNCSIHPQLVAYLLVKDHPYTAVSDADGKLSMKNLPTGKWTFVVWHEARGYVNEVIQNGEITKWPRGRLTVDIKAGVNDLGEIKVPAGTILRQPKR